VGGAGGGSGGVAGVGCRRQAGGRRVTRDDPPVRLFAESGGFSALTTKKLQRSAQRSVKELAADIRAWVEVWNENPKPFVWHKTAEQILERLADYCNAINQATSN
jgi:hypothetical protein